MIIFIDESGDPGLKINKGASSIFVIVMIIFETTSLAEKASFAIVKLRKQMGKSKNYEFKFNKMRRREREKFLSLIKDLELEIRTLVIKKETYFFKRRKYDYGSLLEKILRYNRDFIKNASIRIDKLGGRNYKRSVGVYLRKNIAKGDRILRDFKFVNSKSNDLIQLADVVAGSIGRYYQKEKGDFDSYKKIIKEKIKSELILE